MAMANQLTIMILLSSRIFFSDSVARMTSTHSGDFAVLNEFRRSIKNSELLNWPSVEDADDDPCGSKWKYIRCTSEGRIHMIQLKGLGLNGTLPFNLNNLTMLTDLCLTSNNFTGALPSLSGLSHLKHVFLDLNLFDTIPFDFFTGLTSLEVMVLDFNPLNKTAGWMFPLSLAGSTNLEELSCSGCNLLGELPDFLGNFAHLRSLNLSFNSLDGDVPANFNKLRNLTILKLNNNLENGNGLTGNINFLPSMVSITVAWLYGNSFSGIIPNNISLCRYLEDFTINNNKFTGPVPQSLPGMLQLEVVKLDNNLFLGPVPVMPKTTNFTYDYNSFCQIEAPGDPCASNVNVLIDFLGGLNYPTSITGSWKGNDPCRAWTGITCLDGKITEISMVDQNLTGIISPSLGYLRSLTTIQLGGNQLTGKVPKILARISSLKLLDITRNNIQPPLPKFSSSVELRIENNPLLDSDSSRPWSTIFTIMQIASAAAIVFILCCSFAFSIHNHGKKNENSDGDASTDDRGRINDESKKTIIENIFDINLTGSNSETVQIPLANLQSITENFSSENILGCGGFGVVYKGKCENGLLLAVKRMESFPLSRNSKAITEFHSEISALSKLRHRNLVSLLGYSIEGNERLLVYEYMANGALSNHLFRSKRVAGIKPLPWNARLSIALDMARGLEYLHTLASHSFIHRDLKSSNILLGEDYSAKISDFGLVKSAPDGNSIPTRLAGTFGYLAPEYASKLITIPLVLVLLSSKILGSPDRIIFFSVTGKITTKADVFSFGVVLMELVTGLAALDDNRSKETRHLATWFPTMITSEENLKTAIDPDLTNMLETTFPSIYTVAELAGNCTERDPHQRPDMDRVVNILSPLVAKWKPKREITEERETRRPLLEIVKDWQEEKSSFSIAVEEGHRNLPFGRISFDTTTFNSSDGW
ncbi:putative Receptor protein kinase [Zostera marina]|uniref:Putative Receptor protein kinase n=1 Tax=Zostera marina TaxID=29655 RepID=A0A0K9PDJ2_ZOSMR|nr:putative Receptor protein kinase [Zostera marina]